MTQTEKDLLLKDLCARLPYGVKILIKDTFKYSIVASEHHVLDVSNFSDIFSFNYKKLDKRMKKAMRERPDYIVIKPYLFPLSSMTEEQKNDCPISETNLNIIISNIGCYGIIEIPWRLSFLFVDWCNKNHFDYRGLIPLNLANDATGLNIY